MAVDDQGAATAAMTADGATGESTTADGPVGPRTVPRGRHVPVRGRRPGRGKHRRPPGPAGHDARHRRAGGSTVPGPRDAAGPSFLGPEVTGVSFGGDAPWMTTGASEMPIEVESTAGPVPVCGPVRPTPGGDHGRARGAGASLGGARGDGIGPGRPGRGDIHPAPATTRPVPPGPGPGPGPGPIPGRGRGGTPRRVDRPAGPVRPRHGDAGSLPGGGAIRATPGPPRTARSGPDGP